MNWVTFIEAMLLIIFVSFAVERSLSVFFEMRFYIEKIGERKFLKELMALGSGCAVAYAFDINVMMLVLEPKRVDSFDYILWGAYGEPTRAVIKNWFSVLISGAIFAGGSKLSIKLFRDVLAARSSAEAARMQLVGTAAAKAPADATLLAAQGDKQALANMTALFRKHGVEKKQ